MQDPRATRDERHAYDVSGKEVPAATFAFADIAGFTALTEAHGDHESADLVASFCDAVRAALPADSGAYVKTIGDAVMLRIPDPAEAIRLGVRIVEGMMERPGACGAGGPAPRPGDRAGRRLLRGGGQRRRSRVRSGQGRGGARDRSDRCAGARPRGRVLRVPGTPRAPQRARADRAVRGRAVGRALGGYVIDPVCNMVVDPDRAVGRLVHERRAYFFCTLSCAAAFARDPERFAE